VLDMFADQYAAAAAPRANEGSELPATFGQSFEDSWQAGQDAVSSIKAANAREQATAEYVDQIKAAGGDFDGAYQKAVATTNPLWGSAPDPFTVADGVASGMKAQADAAGRALPFQLMSAGDIDNRAVQISQQAIATNQRNLDRPQTWGSVAGNLLGEGASGLTDPMNIPAMALPFGEMGILATAGAMAAANAGAQTANEAVTAGYNEKVTPGYAESHQAFGNIAEAGVSGALLGGGVKILGNTLTRLATGAWPTAAKDAANAVMSESNILTSNVLPGAEGEAAHQDALASSIGQILRGDPVDPDIAAASQSVMAKAQQDQGFTLPKFDAAEVSRLSEEAELHERSGALSDQIANLPPGDQGAAETLARVQEVERQLGEAATPEARRVLSDRRDELLTDTNPEALQAAAAPVEQRRVAAAEQSSIADRLDEIQSERSQAQLDQITSGEQAQQALSERVPPYQEPTLFDIHTGRIDALMDMREGAIAAGEGSPEAAYGTAGVARGVRALAQIGGSDMAPDEAQALARRVMASGTPDEARFILNQVTDRPRTLLSTLPSPEEFAEAMKADAANAPRPSSLTGDQIREQLAAPETANAARADIERAIDAAAQKGEVLKVPLAVTENGEPIRFAPSSAFEPSAETPLWGAEGASTYSGVGAPNDSTGKGVFSWGGERPLPAVDFFSVADQLAEVDRMNELANQILACATPGAMQLAAE
jgi:hypothetical protein